MGKMITFENDEMERLLELLNEQLDGVKSGSIAPAQPREYEIKDIEDLIFKLEV